MKTTKLITIVFLLTCFIPTLYSQSRTNNNRGDIGVKSKSEKLKSAMGWKQDAMGGWVSNENAISDIQLNDQTRYSVPQNFKWMQFVQFSYNNKDSYALLYENSSYVSNSQMERRVYYYMISPSSYTNMESIINKKTGETLTLRSNTYGYMSDKDGAYSQEKLLNLIRLSMTNTNATEHELAINAQHVDNTDVVRFRLPEQTSIMDDGMKSGYFEVKWADFKSILLPAASMAQHHEEFDLDGEQATVVPVALRSNAQVTGSGNDELSDRNTPSNPPAQPAQTTTAFNVVDNTEQESSSVNNESHNDSDEEQDIMDRVSKERAIVSEPIGILKDIQGWYYNEEGRWVPDSDHTYNFETVGGYELRNFSYRGKGYLVLTRYEKYAGVNYFLISKDEYVQEISKLNTSPILKFRIIAHCGVGNTIEDLIAKGEEAIDAPEKEKIIIRDSYLALQYKGSQAKNIARFFIYGLDCTQYGETGSSSCDVKVSSKVRYDEVSLVGTNDLFSKMYYEVSYTDFNEFLQSPLRVTVTRSQEKMAINNNDDGLGDRN